MIMLSAILIAISARQNSLSYATDFQYLWEAVRDNYAYFDQKSVDWDKVRRVYSPKFAACKERKEFVGLLEQVNAELYDAHAGLNTNTESSPRLIPTGTDMWAEWRNGKAILVEVRPGSPSERAGLRAGDPVIRIQGLAAREAAEKRLGSCLKSRDNAALNWGLLAALAADQDTNRVVWTPRGETKIERYDEPMNNSPVTCRLINSTTGFIRINNSLGDSSLIKTFDRAMKSVVGKKGLVLDLRDTPSGGNSTNARAIMSWFVSKRLPYQRHSSPAEERLYGVRRDWVEEVSPRPNKHSSGRLVVLVDHWTGSMGEGIAIGLDATKSATVVGTPMAGLLGAIEPVELPFSRIHYQFPTEKVFHVDGRPREQYLPRVIVDLTKPSKEAKRDRILDAGLHELMRRNSIHR